jgi:hypothetical protein
MNKMRPVILGSFLAIVSVLPAMGQSSGFTIYNGTGKTITKIEIRPSHKLYRKNTNVFALQGLSVQDKQAVVVSLPPQMQEITAFDVVLKYGSRTAKTKEAMTTLTGNRDTYVAYIKGKSSTVPIIAGGVAGGATAVGIGAVASALSAGTIMFGQAVGAGAVAEALGMAGALVGGGMVVGVGVVAVAPVVVGAVGFGIFSLVNLLTADTLILANVQ